jgi:hypothetical protein
MPIDYSRYPDNWGEIRSAILQRAGNRCEECGVANHARVVRLKSDKYLWAETHNLSYWLLFDPNDYTPTPTKIILTIHHVGVDKPDGSRGDMHDKMDCRPENLKALCQRCHLMADLPDHIHKARITRIKRKAAKAQTTLEQAEVQNAYPASALKKEYHCDKCNADWLYNEANLWPKLYGGNGFIVTCPMANCQNVLGIIGIFKLTP